MPVLYASGEWGSGLGAIAWGRGTAVAGRLSEAGPACCLTPTHLVTQHLLGGVWRVVKVALADGIVTPLSTKGANSLFGNASIWAAFYAGNMRIGTPAGETKTIANAAPVDVARTGVIGYKPNHQTGIGLTLLHPDGASVRISETLARDVAVVPGRESAVWAKSVGLGSANLTIVSVQRPTAKPRVVLVGSVPWLLYQFSLPNTGGHGGRLVFHPFNSLTGYIVTESATNLLAFRPDGIEQPGNTVLIAWSKTEGESVESLQLKTISLSAPRVDVSKLSSTPDPPEPEPMPIPNHLNVVKAARLKYASYTGPERAGLIVNEVAWVLRGEGCGTFYKPTGDNWDDRSIDVVIYTHRDGDPSGKGATFDILGDAEGKANPQWSRTSPSGYGDADKWRAATDPGSDPVPPEPVPPDDHIKARLQDVQRQLTAAQADLTGIINDL